MATENTFCECDTLVDCPLCSTCPVCKGHRMVTFAQAVEFERDANIDLISLSESVAPKEDK